MTGPREDMLATLRSNPRVQVIVIGGGINGISTFRELALQGVRVLLVDRGDFCGACSSAPSRMIHGGLRYLENGEIGLVRESLHERDALLRNAPHFVRPLPTLVPIQHVFSGILNSAFSMLGWRSTPAERGAVVLKIGLTLYDLLTGRRRTLPKHSFRGRQETARLWPDLPSSVRYTATYYDAWISHPERLGIELVLDGLTSASAAAINHLAVTRRDGGRVWLKDALTGDEFAVDTDLIVNATGAWLDETNAALFAPGERPEAYVGGTKGSHLILDHPELGRVLNGHMVYFENVDGRVCILFPYLGRVLLGSTDIRVSRPDGVRCEDDEVDYLLTSLSHVFPRISVDPAQIVYRFSGVRPLPRSQASFTGRVSRDHHVVEIPGEPPVVCLVGGKWTTARVFGEQTADRVLALLGVPRRIRTEGRAIGGGRSFPGDGAPYEALVGDLARQFGVAVRRARHAVDHYGTDASVVLAFCRAGDDVALDGSDYSEAELRYLIRHEFARTLGDLLQRRTSLAITGSLSSAIIARAAEMLAEELGWSREAAASHEAAFRGLLAREHGVAESALAARNSNMENLQCA
jgi:glycerol-3-phosphate dehydrogenase